MKMIKGREDKDEAAHKKGKGRESKHQSEDEMRARKKSRVGDLSARLDDPELRNYQFEPGSSSERPGPPDTMEVTTAEGERIPDPEGETATENRRKREVEVLQRYEEVS